MSILIQAVQAVRQTLDKRWIPEDLRDWSFFSTLDVWLYESENTKGNRCWSCEQFMGMTFFGDELRSMFPDLIIKSATEIYPNVHMTLWGKETCKCKLRRVAEPTAERLGIGI